MTARQILDALAECGASAAVSGAELEVVGHVPDRLWSFTVLLQTGVRAVLTGRRWWASSSGPARVEAISPDAPIPAWVELLCCESDAGTWDRLPADAHIEHPGLFEGGQAAMTPAMTF